MAKTIKLNEETKGKVGSKKEQENLASETNNEVFRKRS